MSKIHWRIRIMSGLNLKSNSIIADLPGLISMFFIIIGYATLDYSGDGTVMHGMRLHAGYHPQ
jgi:hypothetical protein